MKEPCEAAQRGPLPSEFKVAASAQACEAAAEPLHPVFPDFSATQICWRGECRRRRRRRRLRWHLLCGVSSIAFVC